jgi:aldehyde:ferredoxin oxidoreductase
MKTERNDNQHGNAGQILRVDLSANTVSKEHVDRDVFKEYIGGRGLAACYLFKETPQGIDPLSADNRLLFAVGPLTGSKIPYSSRMAVVTKSPLTLGYTRAMTGGHFPAAVKHSFIDGIIIQGKASKPVYLSIDGEKTELMDARDLWGKGVQASMEILQSKHGKKSRFALIGQAGENLVPYACVMIDWKSAAGRGGVGAVMGSKNFKGIVINSKPNYRAADPETLDEFVKECRNIVKTTDAIQASKQAPQAYS